MVWQTPHFTELDMNAEIGAYQEDDPRDPTRDDEWRGHAPIVDASAATVPVQPRPGVGA